MGHGDEQSQLLPKKVEALTGQRVVAVSAGAYHSLAITADGAVWSWGWGASGRLGHGDEQNQWQPKKLEAFAWGKGERGCLGHGEELSNQLLPKKVEAWPPG